MSYLKHLAIFCLVVPATFHAAEAAVSAKRCKGTPPAPIPDTSIGKTFSYWDDCYRPSATETVSVFRKMFVYTPLQPSRHIGGCFEKYIVHYRQPPSSPSIAHFKSFAVPLDLSSSKEIEAYCKAEQANHRELLNAHGATRDRYIKAVRLMIEKIRRIRDFGCYTNEQGFVTQFPGRAYDNVDVDPVISYLHNVAYTNGFCPA